MLLITAFDFTLYCSSAYFLYRTVNIVLSRGWKMKAIGGPELKSHSDLLLYEISLNASQLLNWYCFILFLSRISFVILYQYATWSRKQIQSSNISHSKIELIYPHFEVLRPHLFVVITCVGIPQINSGKLHSWLNIFFSYKCRGWSAVSFSFNKLSDITKLLKMFKNRCFRIAKVLYPQWTSSLAP